MPWTTLWPAIQQQVEAHNESSSGSNVPFLCAHRVHGKTEIFFKVMLHSSFYSNAWLPTGCRALTHCECLLNSERVHRISHKTHWAWKCVLHTTKTSWSHLPCFSAVIFGEDVAFGGVFRCTVGLRDKYGQIIILLADDDLLLHSNPCPQSFSFWVKRFCR